MQRVTTVSELTGHNESPLAGYFCTSSNRDFVNRGVVAGVSILYNKSTGKSDTVTLVSASRIDAPVYFSPGDLFLVTLNAPWTLQNADGPIISVECNVCGFGYPSKELTNGRCKVCIDKPQRS